MSGNHNAEISEASEKQTERSERRATQHHESRLDKAHDFGDRNQERIASREQRSEIVENAVRRDMPETPEKRLTSARDFHYLSDKDFEKELKRRGPGTSDGDAHATLGFHDRSDHQAFVRDQGNTYEIALHEKYHQKSASELPTHMNEGVTEYLAREKAGGIGRLRDIDNHGKDVTPPPAYEHEFDAVRKMAATVGDERIKSAYFEGKTDELRKSIDAAQGDGAYERLQNAIEREDKDGADRVFDKR